MINVSELRATQLNYFFQDNLRSIRNYTGISSQFEVDPKWSIRFDVLLGYSRDGHFASKSSILAVFNIRNVDLRNSIS